MKMNCEIWIFHLGQIEFWTHWEFCATTEYLAFGKVLLARLYQKIKVYITNLLSVYTNNIIYKISHALN